MKKIIHNCFNDVALNGVNVRRHELVCLGESEAEKCYYIIALEPKSVVSRPVFEETDNDWENLNPAIDLDWEKFKKMATEASLEEVTAFLAASREDLL